MCPITSISYILSCLSVSIHIMPISCLCFASLCVSGLALLSKPISTSLYPVSFLPFSYALFFSFVSLTILFCFPFFFLVCLSSYCVHPYYAYILSLLCLYFVSPQPYLNFTLSCLFPVFFICFSFVSLTCSFSVFLSTFLLCLSSNCVIPLQFIYMPAFTLHCKWPVRIQYKCLAPVYVFPEMKLCSLVILTTEL
jgi:hypothetical protein